MVKPIRQIKRAALFGALFLCLASGGVEAQSVGGSCSTAGTLAVIGSSSPGEILVCNGSTWGLAEAITSGGNVGIGTASPGATLDVNAASGTILNVETSGTSRLKVDSSGNITGGLGGSNPVGSTIAFSSPTSMTLPANSTFFFNLGLSSDGATEAPRSMAVPAGGTIKNFYMIFAAAQPASGSLVCTLRKNAANTAISVTVPASAAAGTAHSDTTDTVSVAAGDLLDLSCTNNASAASAIFSSLSFLLVP